MHYIVSTGAVGLSVIFGMLYCYYGPCGGILVLTLCVFVDPPNYEYSPFWQDVFCTKPRAPWCTMVHHGALGFMRLCNIGFGVEAIWPCGGTVVGGRMQGI